jgi:hypothetical protein
MLKPPHPIARTAYALAMWINPNNHALDGGWASSQMEKGSRCGDCPHVRQVAASGTVRTYGAQTSLITNR